MTTSPAPRTVPGESGGLGGLIDGLRRDLRDAIRGFIRNPVFTLVAMTCLAVGVATATTVFSVFEAMLLRPFPFDEPDQIVSLNEINERTEDRAGIGHRRYLEWREGTALFQDIATHADWAVAITDSEEPELVDGQLVSWNLFPMLGITPQFGRLFNSGDDSPGAEGAVLLSEAVWTRLFASNPDILGRVISINGRAHTVIGVMPPRFKFPEQSELWLPMAQWVNTTTRPDEQVAILGRLREGVEVDQADAEIAAYSRRSVRPDRDGSRDVWIGEARTLRDALIGPEERTVTAAMMGAVLFLLLLTCANVANLWLTRAAKRQRDFALRAAIGAGRTQIIRQLLLEAMLLSVVAGIIAVPLTIEAMRLFRLSIPPSDPFPYYVEWSLNIPTMVFAFGATLVTGLVFGIVPALDASNLRPQEELRVGGRGGGGRRRRFRSALVIVEVALALMLLVGASLFVKTFLQLRDVQLGYDPNRIMTMRFFLPGTAYDSAAARSRAVEDLVRVVEDLPGVEAATVSDLIPLEDDGGTWRRVIVEGSDTPVGQEPFLFYIGVAGSWLETFDVSLLSGRNFFQNELRDGLPVAIINQTMAQHLWPGVDPLARRFRLAADSSMTSYTVIGVAPDIRTVKLDESDPTPNTVYLPYRFLETRDFGLLVRTEGSPAALTNPIRAAIGTVDPAIPLFKIWEMLEVKRLSFWMYGVWGTMFSIFGGIALFLAAIGVYAVISDSVTQRTREIGVRMALGARASKVVGLIVSQGARLTAIGLAIGLFGALAMAQVFAELLIGVSPIDLMSYVAGALFLGFVAFLACYLPALRAATVNPTVAMRDE